MDLLLTTTEAAQMAGVGASSIKRWADEGALEVSRTLGGHRRISRPSLEAFLKARTEGEQPEDSLHAELIETLLDGNRYLIDARLLMMRAEASNWIEVADRLAAFLSHVGLAWQAGSLSISQEHMLSEALSRALARVGDSLLTHAPARRCALACVPGEAHTLGLSLAELCVRELGWQPKWLGANTPLEELKRVAEAGQIDCLILAASRGAGSPRSLKHLSCQLERSCQKQGVKLILGGSAFWPNERKHAQRAHAFSELPPLLR